ncbi:MAG: glutamate---cysteine ligase / carboxylate-amine ligase [Gaiellaceae bacterium]|nr:glutamate---cysteine ligase / carboxylate-amine ligase [Gaiellaceae bacterium]
MADTESWLRDPSSGTSAQPLSVVEHAFGSSSPFSLGIEEEFQLVSEESYELVPRFDEVAEAAGDERVRQELMTSVLEAATGVHERVGDAIDEVRDIRARLRDAAAQHGALIASAGTHPFSRWEHQEITDSPRYQGVVEKLRWVAERVAIFGLHVHIGMQEPNTAVRVATGLRNWVPELLALSANSPYWQGYDTGLSSTRSQVFDVMPRSGLPPRLNSFAEFERLVARGAKAGFFPDYTYVWWDVRPHPKLGTIELRVCDAQTRVGNVAGIAALAQALAATLTERPVPVQPRTLISENKWRAARYGLEAELVDLRRDRPRPAREAVRELLAFAGPAAERLGCTKELGEIERLLERGTGADEQRRAFEPEGNLLSVAQWLAGETVRDVG